MSSGQVAAGEILISQFGNDEPIFEIDAIPFLTQGIEETRALAEVSQRRRRGGPAAARRPRALHGALAEPGFLFEDADRVGRRYARHGFRTGSPMTSRMAELLGAVPTAVQGSDIPQAFATNIVTGMVTSAATGVQSRAWEFSTHFIDLRAFMPKNAVIVNERAWQRLPETVKAAMKRRRRWPKRAAGNWRLGRDERGRRTAPPGHDGLAADGRLAVGCARRRREADGRMAGEGRRCRQEGDRRLSRASQGIGDPDAAAFSVAGDGVAMRARQRGGLSRPRFALPLSLDPDRPCERALDTLYLAAAWAGALCVLAICVLDVGQALLRLNGTLVRGADDITAWACAGAAFLPLAATFKRGELVRMGIIIDQFSDRTARWIELMALTMSGAIRHVTSPIGSASWSTRATSSTTARRVSCRSRSGFPQAPVALGALVLAIALVDEWVRVAAGLVPTYVQQVRDRHAAGDYSGEV